MACELLRFIYFSGGLILYVCFCLLCFTLRFIQYECECMFTVQLHGVRMCFKVKCGVVESSEELKQQLWSGGSAGRRFKLCVILRTVNCALM